VTTVPLLGLDIGGVLKPHRVREDNPRFAEALEQTPPFAGAVDGVRRLVGEVFGGRVWVVSKIREANEEPLRAWLRHHGLVAAGLIAADHIHFCRERADKAVIAAGLGLTHFVDDRPEVLSHMPERLIRFLFQPDPDELQRYAPSVVGVPVFDAWPALTEALAASVPHVHRGAS
jgi:hypothetical protein